MGRIRQRCLHTQENLLSLKKIVYLKLLSTGFRMLVIDKKPILKILTFLIEREEGRGLER